MPNEVAALLVLFAVGAMLLTWIIGKPAWIARRRRRESGAPFPVGWDRTLMDDVPIYRRLPDELRRRLQRHVQVFVAEKRFIGCHGLVVTDQMRIVIAAQACLLIFNRPTRIFDTLTDILVYPDEFIADRDEEDEDGVVHRSRRAMAGESWMDSQVVLSWADVMAGAQEADDGYNVVIHEFAHQLDHQTGFANGSPVLASGHDPRAWATVLGHEFEQLRNRVARGEPTLIDEYGAQDPVEFFAVASESFFEQPRRLVAEHPALYGELSRFYCVDPAAW